MIVDTTLQLAKGLIEGGLHLVAAVYSAAVVGMLDDTGKAKPAPTSWLDVKNFVMAAISCSPTSRTTGDFCPS